jgi:Flp pilus assembly protein CpaB
MLLLLFGAYVYENRHELVTGCGWQGPEESVVVARHELRPGHTIAPEDLELVETWRTVVDPRALRTPEQLVGRVPTERILPGELVREERLAEIEAGVGLHAVLPRGTVPVEVPLGASLARPGDSVDVLLTRGHTETLLEDQQIVALVDGPEPRAVLAIPVPEAERVRQALAEGTPTLLQRPSPHLAHGPRPEPPHHSVPLSQMGR